MDFLMLPLHLKQHRRRVVSSVTDSQYASVSRVISDLSSSAHYRDFLYWNSLLVLKSLSPVHFSST